MTETATTLAAHPYADAWPMLGQDVALEGCHLDPICNVRIQESRKHPGYYDVRVYAGGCVSETKRPVRRDFVTLQLNALLRNDTRLTATDLQWATAARTPVMARPDGYVYFIADEDGYIKIGHARDVNSRLRSLQTASRQELRVVASTSGTASDEKALHAKFADAHVRGEWFRATADLMAYITEVSA